MAWSGIVGDRQDRECRTHQFPVPTSAPRHLNSRVVAEGRAPQDRGQAWLVHPRMCSPQPSVQQEIADV